MDKNDKSAADLIERMEKETGVRIDANNGDNAAMAGLFGAISRIMGMTPPAYRESDDVAAGILLLHQMSPAGKREREADDLLASLLLGGTSPDIIHGLLKRPDDR
jgi:hypothetical protein